VIGYKKYIYSIFDGNDNFLKKMSFLRMQESKNIPELLPLKAGFVRNDLALSPFFIVRIQKNLKII